MGQADIREIEAGLSEWALLQKLPASVGAFRLVPGTGLQGQILNIAAYVNEPAHCRLDITYTGETFDYVPVKTVGLHTFRDERFFCRDREKFAGKLLEHLPDILEEMDLSHTHKLGYEAEALRFEQWEYWRSLPRELEGYELFITPECPLTYINGSIVFLDYTDFSRGNQLYLAYNTFRSELFAEMKRNYLPLTTDEFNVPPQLPDERKLQRLTELLQDKLTASLRTLKSEKK